MTIEARLAALAIMSSVERKAEWRRVFGIPAPPAFGAGLLTRAIAHALQEKAAGGPDKALQRRMAQLNSKAGSKKASQAAPSIKPGTWLSRTWHGEVHQVVVLESGYEYRGTRYRSLTSIAKRVTGAAWSGPRFFGLHSPRLGKLSVSANGQR